MSGDFGFGGGAELNIDFRMLFTRIGTGNGTGLYAGESGSSFYYRGEGGIRFADIYSGNQQSSLQY